MLILRATHSKSTGFFSPSEYFLIAMKTTNFPKSCFGTGGFQRKVCFDNLI